MVRNRSSMGTLALVVWMVGVWLSAANQAVGAAQAPAAPAADQAQIEAGRKAVGQACTGCHENILRVVELHRKSADDWRRTVYSMIGRGAHILPEEVEPLTAFLTSVAGRGVPRRTAAAAPAQAPAGADAEVRAILQRQCTRCHDLSVVTSAKPAGGDWKAVIARMRSYGAELSAGDEAKLLASLSK
jgi:mono/diheme cytochrome c family protein